MPPIPMHLAVVICIVLAVFGALILLAIGGVLLFLFVKKLKGKKNPSTTPASAGSPILSGLFGGSAGLAASPLVHELGNVVLQAAHVHAQGALNSVAAQLFPALKPLIPLLDQAASAAAPSALQMFSSAQKLLAEAEKAVTPKGA